jgi:NAD(P)-dependent dehydrogenase (short-subunit alcohol dehydrogenase family)
VVPRKIEQEVQQTLKQRRLRANLELLRAAGAQVDYRAVDVRDAVAFGALIDQIHAQYERVDGVIHAAGVIEDKLTADKSLESFSSVMETKVRSAQVLSEKLDPKSCRFLAFFSSVSGRFGNVGQTDYAAANEVLNKLAGRLDAKWPGRVVAINWGPWDAGMVSDTLRQLYARRGIQLVSVEEGWRYFEAELRGWKNHQPTSEVVVAASVQAIAIAHRGRRRA